MKDKSTIRRLAEFTWNTIDRTAISFFEGAIDTHFIASYYRKVRYDGWAHKKYRSNEITAPLFHFAGTTAALAVYTLGSIAAQKAVFGEPYNVITLTGMAIPVITNLVNRVYEKRRREEIQQEVDALEDAFTNPSSINYD